MKKEIPPFDLQTVSFFALRKRPRIAEFSAFSISADLRLDLAITRIFNTG